MSSVRRDWASSSWDRSVVFDIVVMALEEVVEERLY